MGWKHRVKHVSPVNVPLLDAICASQCYVVCSLKQKGDLAVWNIGQDEEKKEPVILCGHHLAVSAVAISHSPRSFLCSCSADNIIFWDLSINDGHPQRGKVLLSSAREPFSCTFDSTNSKLLVSCGAEVFLFEIPVWKSGSSEAVRYVMVSSGFPTAFTTITDGNLIVIGTSTGNLLLYTVEMQLLRHKSIFDLLNSSRLESECPSEIDSSPVLAIHLISTPRKGLELDGYLADFFSLVVVTSSFLFVWDINIDSLTYFADFQDHSEGSYGLGLVRSASVCQTFPDGKVLVALCPMMSRSVVLVEVRLEEPDKDPEKPVCASVLSGTHEGPCEDLSFLCRKIEVTGLLNHRMKPSSRESKKEPGQAKSRKMFQPLTFHSKVKSSGYGQIHRSEMFKPQVGANVKTNKPMKLKSTGKLSMSSTNCSPFLSEKPDLFSVLPLSEASSVMSAKFSGDGCCALCSSSTGVVDIIKVDDNCLEAGKAIKCHNGAVDCTNWSHSRQLWVSGGQDRAAYLWNCKSQEPLITFTSLTCTGKHSAQVNVGFEDSVPNIQFYYIDQFVLLSSKNCIYLFNYQLSKKTSGIGRSTNTSKCEIVSKIPMECKKVTALAGVNQYYSMLCASSSKCLYAVDMNTQKILWSAESISSRPPYLIGLNEGSSHYQQASCMHEVFLTAALVEGIKLWDLRSRS